MSEGDMAIEKVESKEKKEQTSANSNGTITDRRTPYTRAQNTTKTAEVSKHICVCEENLEAESFCADCKEWLCNQCVSAHKRVRITKDHEILVHDSVPKMDNSVADQNLFCKQHRHEKLKFFCEDCQKLMCRDCQLVEHKDHKYQFLNEATVSYKQQLETNLAMMLELSKKLSQVHGRIEQWLVKQVQTQADALIKSINQNVRTCPPPLIRSPPHNKLSLNYVNNRPGSADSDSHQGSDPERPSSSKSDGDLSSTTQVKQENTRSDDCVITSARIKGEPSCNQDSTSMAGDVDDPNDDECACCHNGGEVLCCERCPCVFHLQCHIPQLPAIPNGVFVCTLCSTEDNNQLGPVPMDTLNGTKCKAPSGLTDKEMKICERLLLELFCHPNSVAFHEPVSKQAPNYYKIIKNPMDFTKVKCKLSRQHFNHYNCVEDFIADVKLVFINCSTYNTDSSEVGKAGLIVKKYFEGLVEKHLPQYVEFSKSYRKMVERLTVEVDVADSEPEAKKSKSTTPPLHISYHYIEH
ncbi:E3 ubiquitin-protein ligase TRIM33-like [Gigantopelta aegis]|uniref:E3 ubiquitin-protein ligase TRIM33-like n=1 Tax=Gigantopelta aegis TaxID=1735272 RepID=UPI001B88973C|nr:E3 ubiquitin-protein ligase TRIM33-like [Gigantopelta aegis]